MGGATILLADRRPSATEKGAGDYVTEVDRASERTIADFLAPRHAGRPGRGRVGRRSGERALLAGGSARRNHQLRARLPDRGRLRGAGRVGPAGRGRRPCTLLRETTRRRGGEEPASSARTVRPRRSGSRTGPSIGPSWGPASRSGGRSSSPATSAPWARRSDGSRTSDGQVRRPSTWPGSPQVCSTASSSSPSRPGTLPRRPPDQGGGRRGRRLGRWSRLPRGRHPGRSPRRHPPPGAHATGVGRLIDPFDATAWGRREGLRSPRRCGGRRPGGGC